MYRHISWPQLNSAAEVCLGITETCIDFANSSKVATFTSTDVHCVMKICKLPDHIGERIVQLWMVHCGACDVAERGGTVLHPDKRLEERRS